MLSLNDASIQIEELKTSTENEKVLKSQAFMSPCYLSDLNPFSNKLYDKIKQSEFTGKYLGTLDTYTFGQILSFLDYKTILCTVRYVSKPFLQFTSEHMNYIEGLQANAYLRVDLNKVYNGKIKMPPLRHAYFENCTNLTLIYTNSIEKEDGQSPNIHEIMFYIDLFQVR